MRIEKYARNRVEADRDGLMDKYHELENKYNCLAELSELKMNFVQPFEGPIEQFDPELHRNELLKAKHNLYG